MWLHGSHYRIDMRIPKFVQLRAREEVERVVRGRLMPLWWKLLLMIGWVAVPFLFLFPLWRSGDWGIVTFVVLLTSGLIALCRFYVRWSRTVLVITDRRVIDHDQQGFFSRVVTEARYNQIDEVSYEIRGVIPTIFRYGTLTLQLHGSSADIEFVHAGRPDRVADLIHELQDELV